MIEVWDVFSAFAVVVVIVVVIVGVAWPPILVPVIDGKVEDTFNVFWLDSVSMDVGSVDVKEEVVGAAIFAVEDVLGEGLAEEIEVDETLVWVEDVGATWRLSVLVFNCDIVEVTELALWASNELDELDGSSFDVIDSILDEVVICAKLGTIYGLVKNLINLTY